MLRGTRWPHSCGVLATMGAKYYFRKTEFRIVLTMFEEASILSREKGVFFCVLLALKVLFLTYNIDHNRHMQLLDIDQTVILLIKCLYGPYTCWGACKSAAGNSGPQSPAQFKSKSLGLPENNLKIDWQYRLRSLVSLLVCPPPMKVDIGLNTRSWGSAGRSRHNGARWE